MNKNISILYPMTGGDMGGSHIALLLLLKNLPKNFKPRVCLDVNGKFAECLKKNFINYTVIDVLKNFPKKGAVRNFLFFLKIQKYLWIFFKENKIDLVHVSDEGLPAIFIIFCFLKKIPVVWYHHNIISESRLTKIAAFISKNNIFVSEYLKNIYPKIKGDLIYNPIEQKKIINFNKQLNNSCVIKLGFFSNLYSKKRPYILIEALRILYEKKIKFYCHMFGDERDIRFDELKKKIKEYKINDFINFSNFSDDIDLHMSNMDIIIVPAVFDSFGRVPIEAMSLKVPVIASNHGGHKESIIDGVTGLFFEPDNAYDLSEKIIFLINNPIIREKIVETAYKEVMKKYSIESHVNFYVNFILKCLSV